MFRNILKSKKLIIFDCDGVLLNSREANIAYFNKCLELSGYRHVSEDFHKKVLYMSIDQLIREVIKDPVESERIFEIASNVEYDPFLNFLLPMFDFKSVLSELRLNFYLSVASNRGRSLVKVFKHFNFFDYFHYKVCTVEAEPKPDPDMLFKTLVYFNLAPDEAVFVGDSISDHKAALNSGIDYIHVGKMIDLNNSETINIESVEDLLSYK